MSDDCRDGNKKVILRERLYWLISNDEDRLSRGRQADAFQADETGDDEQAVDVNEVRDGWHGDADQNAGSSVSALTLPVRR